MSAVDYFCILYDKMERKLNLSFISYSSNLRLPRIKVQKNRFFKPPPVLDKRYLRLLVAWPSQASSTFPTWRSLLSSFLGLAARGLRSSFV